MYAGGSIEESPTEPNVNAGGTHCHVQTNCKCNYYTMQTHTHTQAFNCYILMTAYYIAFLLLADGATARSGEVMSLRV